MASLAEALREAGGQVDATGQLLKGLALQPVAGLGGVGRTMIDLLRGEGVDKSMAAGAKTVEDIEGWGPGPFTQRGQERLEGLGGMVEGATDWAGEKLGNPLEKLGAVSPASAAAATALLETADPTKTGKARRAARQIVRKVKGPNAEIAGAISEATPPTTLRQDIEKAIQAPRESSLPERFQSGEKAGDYRGTEAFGGINPQKLGVARKNYAADAIQGAPYSKYWYDDTSKAIYDLTGGNIPNADRLAHALSVTSSSTPVKSNAMFGFKGWNQDLVGDPVRTGKYPTAMGKDITEGWAALDRGEQTEGVGLKRDPYRAGLSVHWNPNPDIRPTNDIHQMRAWGVTDPKTGKPWSKGVGEAGHRFIDTQTNWTVDKLNQRGRAMQDAAAGPVQRFDMPDWNAYRTQAAAWSPQRVKTGMADTMEEAGGHYGAAVDPYSAHLTREWTPGATSDHMPEMLRESPAVKQEFADAMERAVTGAEGTDRIATGMGALSARTLPNRGVYEGQTNPGYATRIPVGKTTGADVIDPSSAKVMDAVAAAHGLVGVQDQSAWNFLSGSPSNRDVGGFTFAGDKPFDSDQLAALERRLKGLDVDIPQVDPRGARVLHFGDQFGEDMSGLQASAQAAGVPAQAAKKAVAQEYKPDVKQRSDLVAALREAGAGFGTQVEPGTRSGNLFPLKEGSSWEKPDRWSSKPFIERIEAGGPKMVEGFDKTMQGVAPELLSAAEAIATKRGFTQAPFYRPMMEALSTGGLAALKDLVAKGIVPVAAFAAIAEALQGQEEPMQ